MKEVYAFGDKMSDGKQFCILFESPFHYDASEEAIDYISSNSISEMILAKAYVVNTQESKLKTKLHLVFDKPVIKPNQFETREQAVVWLRGILETAKD